MAIDLLFAANVTAAKANAKLSDGGGLRLDVDSSGKNKKWTFRFKSPTTGKERYMGLGSLDAVGLSQARKLAKAARELLAAGIDPIDQKRDQRAAQRVEASRAVTFEQHTRSYIAERESGWKNAKHRQQWTNSLQTYVFPKIGAKPLPDITAADIIEILRPIWNSKPETASRIRGRIEALLDAAAAENLRPKGSNPATWKGHLQAVFTPKGKVRKVKHHDALPYEQLPAFMQSLAKDTSDGALLLCFTILTAARYNEAAFLTPGEITGDVWNIPASRMKADRPHDVPLSDAALRVLAQVKGRHKDSHYLFPGASPQMPISDTTLRNLIGRYSPAPATTHGFRSTFRDWAGDETDFKREVIEAAIAHVVGDETERAYRRGTAPAKRRELLNAWAAFCTSGLDGRTSF